MRFQLPSSVCEEDAIQLLLDGQGQMPTVIVGLKFSCKAPAKQTTVIILATLLV